MPLLMAKAEVGVAVAEPETPMAQALDLAMAPAIPMIALLRILATASPLLVDLVRVLVVAVGKVMINMPQVTEEGVHLAQAMVTPVIFTVMGLPMQMGVGAAVAPEEVLATAKGMVMAQEMGKVLPTAMDHMVQATPIVEEAEVEGVVVMMVDVTTTSRTVRSRLADSPRGIARYLAGRMWDPLVRSLFLLISSRTERR